MSQDAVSNHHEQDRVPIIGTRWVWEIELPHARCLLEVTDVWWNGEEWWVETLPLLPDSYRHGRHNAPDKNYNELDRFWEACTPVGGNKDEVTGFQPRKERADA